MKPTTTKIIGSIFSVIVFAVIMGPHILSAYFEEEGKKLTKGYNKDSIVSYSQKDWNTYENRHLHFKYPKNYHMEQNKLEHNILQIICQKESESPAMVQILVFDYPKAKNQTKQENLNICKEDATKSYNTTKLRFPDVDIISQGQDYNSKYISYTIRSRWTDQTRKATCIINTRIIESTYIAVNAMAYEGTKESIQINNIIQSIQYYE